MGDGAGGGVLAGCLDRAAMGPDSLAARLGPAGVLGLFRGRPPEVVVLVRADGGRQAERRSVEVQGSGLAVVAREDAGLRALLGRQRQIPEMVARNPTHRAAGERMANNMPSQGTAADIVKIAMIRLDERLRAGGFRARPLLQVHDELLFEVPESEVDQFAEKVPRIMTGAYELETGIEVETKVGPNWADMKKLAVVRV